MKWKEISKAPKDGSLFLGFAPHDCGGYICVFYWNAMLNKWQNNIDGGFDNPTHWMPLPESPKT